jgi:hypothetical protein
MTGAGLTRNPPARHPKKSTVLNQTPRSRRQDGTELCMGVRRWRQSVVLPRLTCWADTHISYAAWGTFAGIEKKPRPPRVVKDDAVPSAVHRQRRGLACARTLMLL